MKGDSTLNAAPSVLINIYCSLQDSIVMKKPNSNYSMKSPRTKVCILDWNGRARIKVKLDLLKTVH